MLSAEQILRLQEIVRQVPVADHVFAYAADLVRATRPREPGVPTFVKELLSWGAGPRASQYLILGGKARALLHGRLHVDDRRHRGAGLAGAAASPGDDLQRRRRGRHPRRRSSR